MLCTGISIHYFKIADRLVYGHPRGHRGTVGLIQEVLEVYGTLGQGGHRGSCSRDRKRVIGFFYGIPIQITPNLIQSQKFSLKNSVRRNTVLLIQHIPTIYDQLIAISNLTLIHNRNVFKGFLKVA